MIPNHRIQGRLLLAALIALSFSGAAAARSKTASVRAPSAAAKTARSSPAAKDAAANASEAKPLSADDAAEQAAMKDASPDLKDRLALSHDKFALLDANKDGFIDRSEATASTVLQARFDKYDTNRDGKLSVVEFAAINDLASIELPQAADQDQDKDQSPTLQ